MSSLVVRRADGVAHFDEWTLLMVGPRRLAARLGSPDESGAGGWRSGREHD